MACPHSTITGHKKGKHLTFEERIVIQIRLKDGCSIRAIAREISCSPSTVSNEIERGTVSFYYGHVQHYKASAGQDAYRQNRSASCRHNDMLEKSSFLKYVQRLFFDDGWSLDACFGRALAEGSFARYEMVCTKTLYRNVDLSLIGIKNHNLPEKLGRSIGERDPQVESREEFGH